MGYMNKKSETEIETALELPGCECDFVFITHGTLRVDREQFVNSASGFVRFDGDRSGRDNSVQLEGTFTKEEILALYLMMEEDSDG